MPERFTLSIVDDDDLVCRSLKRIVSSFGYRVEVFDSAEDFLCSDCLSYCDCLILDVRMPGINGLELQKQLSARNANFPIIFITSQSDDASKEQALTAGAVDYILKPFKTEQLLNAIRNAFGLAGETTEMPVAFNLADKFAGFANAE